MRKETRLVSAADGRDRLYRERVRLYEPRELAGRLTTLGFVIEAILGDYDGRSFEEGTSPRLILVAQTEAHRR